MKYSLIDLYHIKYALKQEVERKKNKEEKDNMIESYQVTLTKTEEFLKGKGCCEVEI